MDSLTNKKFINNRIKFVVKIKRDILNFPLHIEKKESFALLLKSHDTKVVLYKAPSFFCVKKTINILKKNYNIVEKLVYLLTKNYFFFVKKP